MKAQTSTKQAAMVAAERRTNRMSFSMPAMRASIASAATSTSIRMKETGVMTSVSLFVVGLLSLLLSLVVLLSLLISRLAGLVGLVSLVGLDTELAIRPVRGD